MGDDREGVEGKVPGFYPRVPLDFSEPPSVNGCLCLGFFCVHADADGELCCVFVCWSASLAMVFFLSEPGSYFHYERE